jgi:hypothetical protein
MYETWWGSGVAYPSLETPTAVTPYTGSLSAYEIKPTNINVVATFTFTLKVTLEGGAVFQLPCTLVTTCGLLGPPRSYAAGAGFLTTHTLTVQHGVAVQSITFPEFVDSINNCPMIGYKVDTDTNTGSFTLPSGVTYPAAACAETPCRTIEFDTTGPTTYQYYIYVEGPDAIYSS